MLHEFSYSNSFDRRREKRITNNEQMQFSEKLKEYNQINGTDYKFYPIPRILYDLFYVESFVYGKINRDITNDFSQFMKYYNYDEYCREVDKCHNNLLDIFIKINNEIHGSILVLNFHQPFNYVTCTTILHSILEKLEHKKREILEPQVKGFLDLTRERIQNETFIDKEKPFDTSRLEKRLYSYIVREYFVGKYETDDIVDFIVPIFKEIADENVNKQVNNEEILKCVKNPDFIKKAFENHRGSYTDNQYVNKFMNMTTKGKNILLRTLQYEIGISTIFKPNIFVIYRGSSDNIETTTELNENRGYSISYNTSILNGLINDNTACTYFYMLGTDNEDPYKTRYRLKKHFYGDNSQENNLFFIPPLHPCLQLTSFGEFWHPRSKIFNGSEIKGIKKFARIYDDYDGKNAFPDFLKSNYDKNVMKRKFDLFIKQNRSEIIEKTNNENIEAALFGGYKYFNKYQNNKYNYMNLLKM